MQKKHWNSSLSNLQFPSKHQNGQQCQRQIKSKQWKKMCQSKRSFSFCCNSIQCTDITSSEYVISKYFVHNSSIDHSRNVSVHFFCQWTVFWQYNGCRHVDPNILERIIKLFIKWKIYGEKIDLHLRNKRVVLDFLLNTFLQSIWNHLWILEEWFPPSKLFDWYHLLVLHRKTSRFPRLFGIQDV